MFRTIIILTSIFYLSNLSINAQVPSNMTGSWQGYVVEDGRSNPYHVSLNLILVKEGEKAGDVWYRDYNCGGTLKYLGIYKEEIHIFKEELTTKGTCIDNGYIYAMMVDGKFSYIWGHKNYDHQAKGYLKSND